MYCPSCGSNNPADIKFCTRCGTNLSIVSDALSGKPASPPELDERMVGLFKDYYNGRRNAALGGASLAVGLIMLMLMFVIGFPEKLIFLALIALGLQIYGASMAIWGVSKWFDSSSEMKALGYAIGNSLPQATVRASLDSPPAEPVTSQYEKYTTDPIKHPGSITEHTTRQLDEHVYRPPVDGQSGQSQ
jgi:hypothetical protein